MLAHNDKFEVLGTDNAPGQEVRPGGWQHRQDYARR
jgi:hypothetical protein